MDNRGEERCFCRDGDTEACGTDVGACERGVRTCRGGRWGDCEGGVTAQAERCDGVDNDCDGDTDVDDAGEPLSRSCYTGPPATRSRGRCVDGRQTCAGGIFEGRPCAGEVLPRQELEHCDGEVDDDCDGQVDEGCICMDGEVGPCGDDVGICERGTHTCSRGDWLPCFGSRGADPEVCDGLDNDCNGQTDEAEDLVPPPICPDAGICRAGRVVCLGNDRWTCQVPGREAEEASCDGLDNDCDGATDEGCDPCLDVQVAAVGLQAGTLDAGATRHRGACGGDGPENVLRFVAPATGVWAFSTAGSDFDTVLYVREACGEGTPDDPCNDDVSQGVPTSRATGWLDQGETVYLFVDAYAANGHGSWILDIRLDCAPSEEVCDGLDNDCDGVPNNPPGGCDCVNGQTQPCGSDVGECVAGTRTCVNGGWPAACDGERGPADEVCNGRDDDCDGRTDTDAGGLALFRNCYSAAEETRGVGRCRAGVQTCAGGGWGACADEVTPADEVCNGSDDDCDGELDDGFAYGADGAGVGEACDGVGACGPGTVQCADGASVRCSTDPGGSADQSRAEVPGNDVDDDCDAETDEADSAGCVAAQGDTWERVVLRSAPNAVCAAPDGSCPNENCSVGYQCFQDVGGPFCYPWRRPAACTVWTHGSGVAGAPWRVVLNGHHVAPQGVNIGSYESDAFPRDWLLQGQNLLQVYYDIGGTTDSITDLAVEVRCTQ